MPSHPIAITQTDEAILYALNRYTYLTPKQASRLLYPYQPEVNRYVRLRLAALTQANFILKLGCLPLPSNGNVSHVYTLGRKGRQYLADCGYDLADYFRPSEEQEKSQNRPYMQHTLAAIDVLIAADLLCRKVPKITCPVLMTERELKRHAVRVEVPPSDPLGSMRKVSVIPDGWFQFVIGNDTPISIAMELDRGTESQKYWRAKVAALSVWALGPYQEKFQTDTLTIAVVTNTPARRDQLLRWTTQELAARNVASLSEVFLITSADPVTTPPESFFADAHWYSPGEPRPVWLIGGEAEDTVPLANLLN